MLFLALGLGSSGIIEHSVLEFAAAVTGGLLGIYS